MMELKENIVVEHQHYTSNSYPQIFFYIFYEQR